VSLSIAAIRGAVQVASVALGLASEEIPAGQFHSTQDTPIRVSQGEIEFRGERAHLRGGFVLGDCQGYVVVRVAGDAAIHRTQMHRESIIRRRRAGSGTDFLNIGGPLNGERLRTPNPLKERSVRPL
jgi:hypothetical protein